MRIRSHRAVAAGGTLALSILLVTVPVRAMRLPSNGPASGIVAVDAWTNDDGIPDHGDPGDTGITTGLFDAWGAASSPDPRLPGWLTARSDKDVARCDARTQSGLDVSLVIENAYPGYVCTFAVVYVNTTRLPIEVIDSNVIVSSSSSLAISAMRLPESIVPDGEPFTVEGAVTVEHGAPVHAELSFVVEFTMSRTRNTRGGDGSASTSADADGVGPISTVHGVLHTDSAS